MDITADDSKLLPLPAAQAPAAGAPLAAGQALHARFPGVRTRRLERAAARFLDLRPVADGPGRPLTLHCATASSSYPDLRDDEAYVLEASASGVRIAAAEEWGVLRGLATLTQLCSDGQTLPACHIEDQPRFAWRGLMLDVARHFIPLKDLLRTLDAMAVFKLNVLHLHLSDDQAFRFPSARFPRLASEAHYSAVEIRTLVGHAADLGIRLVPELDVPGHTACWLTAYPEWGNRPAQSTRRFGVHRECLDPTRPQVREALEVLFAEVADAFPDTWIHIGGDEVHPDWWSGDARIDGYMTRHNVPDAAALQARFNGDMAELLKGLGKRMVGWDEVLHGDLPRDVVVQAWRGVTARDRALRAGHDCIMSAPYYLDLMYPADVHYAFDPAAPETELLTGEDAMLHDPRLAHVAAGMAWTRQWRQVEALPDAKTPGSLLGAEACLWSELVDARVLDVRLWSRLPALAERFWSPADCSTAGDMEARLGLALQHLPRWAGVDVAGDVRRLVTEAGVAESWWPLVEMLEPVKWYGRLLGDEALQARLQGREMPQARPYDADTPLNRVVDALPPQALGVTTLMDLLDSELGGDSEARQGLRELAARWRSLPESGGPAELSEPAGRLAALGTCVLGVLDGAADTARVQRIMEQAAAPMGEYLLAPAVLLQPWLARRHGLHGEGQDYDV